MLGPGTGSRPGGWETLLFARPCWSLLRTDLAHRHAEPFCNRTLFARQCRTLLRTDLADLHAETYIKTCLSRWQFALWQATYNVLNTVQVSGVVTVTGRYVSFSSCVFRKPIRELCYGTLICSRLLCEVPDCTASSLFCNLTDGTLKCSLDDVHNIWIQGSYPAQGVKACQT
jgi:hypothetical protein